MNCISESDVEAAVLVWFNGLEYKMVSFPLIKDLFLQSRIKTENFWSSDFNSLKIGMFGIE